MATQRYISTSFWDDSWIQSIDPSEKLMYLYLMTNPLTNIAGIYKITDKRIHDDTGFNVDMVNRILQRFEKARKCYRQGEYIIIPTWPKHQKWREKKTIEAGIRSIIAELPNSIRDKAKVVGYQYPIDSVPVSYVYEPSYSDIDSDSDSDSDNDTPEEPAIPSKPKRVKKEKEAKKTYGIFKNVLLSERNYSELKEVYTENVLLASMDAVSKYIQGHPTKHYSVFNKVLL